MAHVAAAARPAVALLRVRRRRGGRVAAVDLLLQYAVDDAAGPGDAFEIILRAAVAVAEARERRAPSSGWRSGPGALALAAALAVAAIT